MRSRTRFGVGIALAGTAIATAAWNAPTAHVSSECTSAATVRSAKDSTDDFRLFLNVPAYRLDVVERQVVVRSISVAVGQPRYPTPLGHFQLDYAVWNPWWHPPASDWARKERPKPPGWANPVGRVKLHVSGLVFLHGTPLEDSRGSAASHACVRMSNEDAIALARLVHEHAGPRLSDALLDSLVADTTRTRTIALSRTVPIDVEYRLAELRANELVVYPDVYRLATRATGGVEGHAIAALLRARIDTSGLAIARLRVLVRQARRAPARISVDSLVNPRVPDDR
jgi:murein L,D-transpeptidase YcbB/YkuD